MKKLLLLLASAVLGEGAAPVDWIERSPSGAYQFGYATGDEGGHYRTEAASADNTVAGKYGFRDPASGGNLETTYTAGRRGFRARGPHIARRMDLSQNGPIRPKDDGQYHPELDVYDPTEDKGYDFSFRTADVVKEEHAEANGDVRGRYTYLDDTGGRHSVDYTAGAGKGFNVNNPVPDTFAQAQGSPLYFQGKGPGHKARGYTAVQKSLDGSYRFAASGPEHKHTEISDARNNRRGSYTYLDDKGQKRTVEYIAGPNIGFQIINNKRPLVFGPNGAPIPPSLSPFFPDSPTPIPSLSPFFPDPSDFPSLYPTFPSSTLTPPSGSPFPSPSPSPGSIGTGGGTISTSGASGSISSSDASGSLSSTGGSGSITSGGLGSTSSTPSGWSPSTTPSTAWWGPTTTAFPPSTAGPSWLDISDPHYGDFNYLHHQLFPESLHTAQSGGIIPRENRTQSQQGQNSQSASQTGGRGSCCGRPWQSAPRPGSSSRGSVKFESPDFSGKILALRAHVQSIDMLEGKRFMSPGEALQLYSREHPDHHR